MSVLVTGVGMTRQGRHELGPETLASDAARAALADADIAPARIGLVLFSNALGGLLCDQECIRGQSWLRACGIGTAPVVNIDNGCAGGASALNLGYLAAQAGAGPVLVVGVEKMWTGDRVATLNGIENCLTAEERPVLRSTVAGAAGSVFMGLNAGWARRQLADRGHTLEQFAAAAVKAHRHGAANPKAQHQREVTAAEVLGSPVVEAPLTRLMCSSFTDGGAAVVLEAGTRVGVPRIRASVARSGDTTSDYHGRLSEVAQLAFDASALGPRNIQILELHDATSAEELYALESLGFYGEGEAGHATLRGETTFGSRATVVNPSGGLVARGHPIGATGLAQVFEIVEQLRQHAGARQVAGAAIGMSVNTGGILSGDVGAIAVHIIERG